MNMEKIIGWNDECVDVGLRALGIFTMENWIGRTSILMGRLFGAIVGMLIFWDRVAWLGPRKNNWSDRFPIVNFWEFLYEN
jgi:type II secretory pathway component PulF